MGRRRTVGSKNWARHFDPDEAAFRTEGAEVDELAGESMKERFPVDGRVGQQQCCRSDIEQATAGGNFFLAVAIGEEAEVADADEAGGQDVEEETAEELDGFERQNLFDTAVAVILPAEPEAAVLELEQAMIGDSDFVGIAAEIVNDLGGATEGALGIDNPALTAGGA